MPTYTFNISPRRDGEDLVTVTADRESEAAKLARWMIPAGHWSDGYHLWQLIKRQGELTRGLALTRSLARRDLNDAGVR